jgi:hypothetical protein
MAQERREKKKKKQAGLMHRLWLGRANVINIVDKIQWLILFILRNPLIFNIFSACHAK